MLPCHGLRLCLRIVLAHPSFIPSNEFQLELSLLPTKTEYLIETLPVSTHTHTTVANAELHCPLKLRSLSYEKASI